MRIIFSSKTFRTIDICDDKINYFVPICDVLKTLGSTISLYYVPYFIIKNQTCVKFIPHNFLTDNSKLKEKKK